MSLSIASLNHWLRVCAAAMLLSSIAHALLPVGAPLERRSGSAFSATTSETTIDVGRAAQVRKLPAAKTPGGDPDPLIPVLLLAVFLTLAGPLAATGSIRHLRQPTDHQPRRLRPNLGSRAPPAFS
jgi:hypothetical protein